MKNVRVIFAVLLAVGLSWSCAKSNPNFDDFVFDGSSTYSGPRQDRSVTEETRRVLIMYSAGFNSLSSYLEEDITDLTNGYVPIDSRNADVLLIISRLAPGYKQYSTPVSPVLIRLTREAGQETRRDTIKVWPAASAVTSPSFMREALEYIRDEFPAKGYGLVYSSHGTGWLPPKYYADPSKFEPGSGFWSMGKRRTYPAIEEFPAVKSLGQDEGNPYYEMEIKDLGGVFPMHLDYFIVDACLMGCVELAYEVRDVCDYVAFSQTEVLAEGLNYTTLTSHLLEKPTPDVESVCKDYYNCYDAKTGTMRSATISMIDCRQMDNLASTCATLFAKYQTELHSINANAVQRYFRFDRHYFYDLQDILLHCGINDQERAALQTELNKAVRFKAATPRFMEDFDINVYSGFSMYLPANGTDYLNNYYRENISWNAATGLVP
ncbi:MAG: hypothetical protein K6A64_10145 [Bacteroidales bacterium]|nr:hypothetical protein [Bacteroidales bacterium]